MSERRMTDVVHEGERFDQISIKPEFCRNRARNLRDFDSVSQAVAEMVGVAASKYLRFCFEAAKGARVHDAVAVALKFVSVRMRQLGKATSA